MNRGKALDVVIQAAESWSNELSEYIIPASNDANDGCDYQTGYDELSTALEVLGTKPQAPDGALPQEFLDKRQSLAMFLLAMATGWTWEEAEGIDDYHENYTKDADDILRDMPHLMTLPAREQMGL